MGCGCKHTPIAKGKGYGLIPMGVALTLCMSLVDL